MNLSSLLFVVVVGCFAHVISAAPKYSKCYEHDDDGIYSHFSTRTAYEYVRGIFSRPEASKTCEPTQVWMLSRHGTRYPELDSMNELFEVEDIRDRIVKNHNKGDGSLCSKTLNKLHNWHYGSGFETNSAGELSSQGENDMRQLAKRLHDAFPELFKPSLGNVRQEDYLLRSTNITRTQNSMKYFSCGLFGTTNTAFQEPPANDTLLLAHEHCPSWEADLKADAVLGERRKFQKSPVVQSLIEDLSSRLGFSKPLKFHEVKMMYDMCRFETALYMNLQSVWCSLFKKKEFKILEYREDLRQYYYSGPGRPINVKLGCQTLSDMFKYLKNVATEGSTSGPKGIFYFAHTVTLQALMSALGVNKEAKPLMAEDYSTSKNRHYRASLYGPFASNVVAVSYRCDHDSSSKHKVSIHVNEKLIEMPGCNNGLCDWEYLERKFHQDVEHCTMDFCYN